jgi:hypothetical protein
MIHKINIYFYSLFLLLITTACVNLEVHPIERKADRIYPSATTGQASMMSRESLQQAYSFIHAQLRAGNPYELDLYLQESLAMFELELRNHRGISSWYVCKKGLGPGFYHFELPSATLNTPYLLQLRADGRLFRSYKITKPIHENSFSRK